LALALRDELWSSASAEVAELVWRAMRAAGLAGDA
jgi:hypothetical protein